MERLFVGSLFLLLISNFVHATHVASAQDIYEPDNEADKARSVSVGAFPRQQNLHGADDEDWILFWAGEENQYEIFLNNKGDIDLKIQLYKENDLILLRGKDDGFEGQDETVQLKYPFGEGFYLARIFLAPDTLHSANNAYEISVNYITAPVTITVSGTVRDLKTKTPIANILVLSDNPAGFKAGYKTESDGYYELHIDPTAFCLQAKQICEKPLDLYLSQVGVCENEPSSEVEKNIILSQAGLQKVIEILQLISGMASSFQAGNICDLNGDNRIGIGEAIFILQKMANIR